MDSLETVLLIGKIEWQYAKFKCNYLWYVIMLLKYEMLFRVNI